MSGCLQRIQSSCASYAENFPTDLPTRAALSFGTTAVNAIVQGVAPEVAATAGAVALLATVAEAAARPIIQDAFGKGGHITRALQFGTLIVTVRGASAALDLKYGTHIAVSILGFLFLNNDRKHVNDAYAVLI